MADYEDKDRDGEKRPKVEVIIEDLRHRRSDGEGDESEAEQAGGPTGSGRPADPPPAAAAAPAAPAASAPPAAAENEPPLAQPAPAAGAAGDDAAQLSVMPGIGGDSGLTEEQYLAAGDYEGEDMPPGEMEQIRALFSGGLINYLRGQLGLLLNFALLGMGRAADPSTGLLTKNLPQAKIAIDLLEFIVSRVEPELPPEERAQMKALVSDLKYAFMQAASEPVPGSPVAES